LVEEIHEVSVDDTKGGMEKIGRGKGSKRDREERIKAGSTDGYKTWGN